MRILGIDPGLNTTGYGVISISGSEASVLEGGVVRTGSAQDPLELRLSQLYDGLVEVLEQFYPQALALEELYSHYEHPNTAVLMGHARGVICLAAARSSVPVFNYASTEIKSCLTGNGQASKEQVQRAIQVRLRIGEFPNPDDVADALAVAVCHHWKMSSPVMAVIEDKLRRNPEACSQNSETSLLNPEFYLLRRNDLLHQRNYQKHRQ